MTAHVTPDDASLARTPPIERASGTPVVVRLLVLATFVVILNETIMVNAIPRLMADLHVTEHAAQWVSTAFMLTMAAVIPITGWFLQRVTTRAAYTIAMAVFIAGTLLAALAPTFGVLLGGRIVQAVGTAVMMPLLMTTVMRVVPAADRGRVMGNVALAISVAPALGPTVSGLLLNLGSWRLLFWVMLPIAGAVGYFGLQRLENVGETTTGVVDWASVVLAAGGFGTLVYGLTGYAEGTARNATAIVASGAVLIALFVARQLRLQRIGSPLMDLRTLTHSVFARALLVMVVAVMAMLGAMVLLPIYLQNLRGLSALQAGLLVMPGGLAMGLLGPTVGRVFDARGGRVLVIPGTVGVAVALAGLSLVDLTTPYAAILGLHMVLMVCLAAIFTPVFTLGLGALPEPLYPHGSSIFGTLQQVGAALGTALSVTVMGLRSDVAAASGAAPEVAHLEGMTWAFGTGAAIAVVVVVIACTLPRRVDAEVPAPAHA